MKWSEIERGGLFCPRGQKKNVLLDPEKKNVNRDPNKKKMFY